MELERLAACAEANDDYRSVSYLGRGSIIAGNFVVLETVSEGLRSTIYKCRSLDDSRRILAIKVLAVGAAQDPRNIAAFSQEYYSAKSVLHANVLKVHDYLWLDDTVAYTMDYVSGSTLAQLLIKQGQLSLTEVTDFGLQICAGLRAIHQAGLVHNDLCPHNIIVGDDGKITIAGFASATSICDRASAAAECIRGNLEYLSPEYVLTGIVRPCSDVYSFGLMLCEMTTGQYPFTRLCSPIESLRQRLSTDALPPVFSRAGCPAQLSQTIVRAMRRNPEARYQSVGELTEELRALLSVLPDDLPHRDPQGLACRISPVDGQTGNTYDLWRIGDGNGSLEPQLLPVIAPNYDAYGVSLKKAFFAPCVGFCSLFLALSIGIRSPGVDDNSMPRAAAKEQAQKPRASAKPAAEPANAVVNPQVELANYTRLVPNASEIRFDAEEQDFSPAVEEPIRREQQELYHPLPDDSSGSFFKKDDRQVVFSQLDFVQTQAKYERENPSSTGKEEAEGRRQAEPSQLDFDL